MNELSNRRGIIVQSFQLLKKIKEAIFSESKFAQQIIKRIFVACNIFNSNISFIHREQPEEYFQRLPIFRLIAQDDE